MTGNYKGLQGITGVTSGYMVLQLVTRGYKGIEKTCFLTRMPPDTFLGLFCRKRLQGVTRRYKGLQGVTRGYKRLQGITRGYTGLQGVPGGLRGVTRSDKGCQGVTKGYSWLQRVKRGYKWIAGG